MAPPRPVGACRLISATMSSSIDLIPNFSRSGTCDVCLGVRFRPAVARHPHSRVAEVEGGGGVWAEFGRGVCVEGGGWRGSVGGWVAYEYDRRESRCGTCGTRTCREMPPRRHAARALRRAKFRSRRRSRQVRTMEGGNSSATGNGRVCGRCAQCDRAWRDWRAQPTAPRAKVIFVQFSLHDFISGFDLGLVVSLVVSLVASLVVIGCEFGVATCGCVRVPESYWQGVVRFVAPGGTAAERTRPDRDPTGH